MQQGGQPLTLPAQALLPEFCRSHILFRIIILLQVLAILLALVPGVDSAFWPRLGFVTLCIHWVGLPILAFFCSARPYLVWWQGRSLAGLALIVLLLNSWLVGTLAFDFLRSSGWRGADDYHSFILQVLLIALLIGGAGIQLLVFYVQQRLRLDAQARSELDALQARIRPHFLFNSLNTAAELVHTDQQAAEQTLLDLAALFRAALHADAAISLAEDLQLAWQYLSVEQRRLASRLTLDWQVPAELPAVLIPCLTIQPLVENAIRHGIEPMTAGGTITVQLCVGQDAVSLTIINPLANHAPHSGGNGIALDNIRRRLALLYGDKGRIINSVSQGDYYIKLTLPLEVRA